MSWTSSSPWPPAMRIYRPLAPSRPPGRSHRGVACRSARRHRADHRASRQRRRVGPERRRLTPRGCCWLWTPPESSPSVSLLPRAFAGADSGYSGYPHPTSSALRALAEAWRGEPELTRRIVEAEAAEACQEARDQLARVPWFLERFREPWDASAAATAEAISFIVRRAGGDWGEEAAYHASDHLASLARDIPEAVAEHVDGMLGAILALCAPPSQPVLRPGRARRGCDGRGAGTRIAADPSQRCSSAPSGPGHRSLRLRSTLSGVLALGAGAVLCHDWRREPGPGGPHHHARRP